MLANPLAKYAVMNPIFSPSTHPIQPNTVETTNASRFFKSTPFLLSMLEDHRPLPRLPVPNPVLLRPDADPHPPRWHGYAPE